MSTSLPVPAAVPTRGIRAVHSADTLTVYQAYSPAIALPAAAAGRFPADYGRGRMTWIKPSFLWMMYRSAWATAPGQERVLAIRIRREGLDWALAHAALSSYTDRVHASRDQWRQDMRRCPVRVQWDPERDLHARPLAWRSLQVGLRGEAVDRYLDAWVTGIEDVTGLAHTIHAHVRAKDLDRARALLPDERPYPLDAALAGRVDATPATEGGTSAVGPVL
ncbi:protein of unknown function [Actinacidiphila yanglinensis]|uniref:DUF4291 domain-containing protein n=1 Tax=Actinacidiphila yanglinensis TaxID=310779 RepID=A0A1H6AHD8_9ACTN|nr:DUF4291 domain-containing protein [Actinacidiphila yanglinensis]SEG47921.1 protein of unknown function [Actinacidiphila yanglinensis]